MRSNKKTARAIISMVLIAIVAFCAFATVSRVEAFETPAMLYNSSETPAEPDAIATEPIPEEVDITSELVPFAPEPEVEAIEIISEATEEVFITSSPDITLSYEYVESDVMPYILFTPSTAETNEKTPLIISLHGMGDRGTSASAFQNKFISKMLLNWELEGFNAYVMIPHLSGAGYAETWNSPYVAEKLFAVIDQFIEEHNIDTDRIIMQGQSMGGYGCLYMAAYHPEYFSAVVPISSYNSNADLTKLEGMPIRCYVGSASHGESGSSVKFVTGTLAQTFGDESIFQRLCSHDEIPIVAFTEDLNEDGKSDLIEWMLSQTKSEQEPIEGV